VRSRRRREVQLHIYCHQSSRIFFLCVVCSKGSVSVISLF
jgi:hypothetical protein